MVVFEVQHRAYGVLTEDPLDSFFGLGLGANVHVGLRYAVLPRLEIKAAYTTFEKEYALGASYGYHLSQLYFKGQLDVQYFNFERSGERNGNFLFGAALQSYPLGNIVIPTINVAYDGFNEKFGMGIGIDIGFDWSFGPLEHISFIGEYYPILQAEEAITRDENYFAAGVRLDTYGHHFMLQVGNGSEIGPRRLMLGAPNNDIHIGFNIHRILQL